MPKTSVRLKVLKASRRNRHRYDRLRALSQAVSLAILVAVPFSGLARVDLWTGKHELLFRAAPIKHGIAGVIVGFSALYVFTFLSNVVAGRMFCGWGCPVGQITRFGEVLDTPRLTGRQRVRAHLAGAAFSAVFVLALFAWWVDLRVFWQAAPRALAVAWSSLAVSTALAYLHGRWWKWAFCKSACPIGLYYSFVSPANWYGVHFRNRQDSCIECNACDNVCPVSLTPRDLMEPIPARAGASIANAPGRNHCLECGDCIRACEMMMELKGDGPVPLLLGYHGGPQRVDRPAPEPSEKEAPAR